VRFVSWMACNRKLTAATISVYLAGIRQLHVSHGLAYPELRSDLVKSLIQGKRNQEIQETSTEKRYPVTAALLLKIKSELKQLPDPLPTKRLIWSVCTMLFFSACRASELLSRSANSFDRTLGFTDEKIKFLVSDLNRKKIILEISSPKESRNHQPIFVEVFQTANRDICPIAAWEKWQAANRLLSRHSIKL